MVYGGKGRGLGKVEHREKHREREWEIFFFF